MVSRHSPGPDPARARLNAPCAEDRIDFAQCLRHPRDRGPSPAIYRRDCDTVRSPKNRRTGMIASLNTLLLEVLSGPLSSPGPGSLTGTDIEAWARTLPGKLADGGLAFGKRLLAAGLVWFIGR